MNDTKDGVKKTISDCFRKIGLAEPAKSEHFWRRLEKKHGQIARDFGKAVEQRGNGNWGVDPYEIKNVSESLSLDITGQYESKLYRDFIEWLANEQFEPSATILELGCGNGVMSILLASIYPSSKIVAIDLNAKGVEIGRSIAKRLGVKNIEWVVGDVTAPHPEIQQKHFDLVIAVKVFHEILERPDLSSITGHSIASISGLSLSDRNIEVLDELPRYMSPNSTLISMDRWSSAESFGWWVRTVERVGLRISLDHSWMLKTAESGSSETFPISVLELRDERPSPTDEQLLSFFAYPQLIDILTKLGQVEGPAAEALFLSLGHQRLIASLTGTYRDGSGVQKTELIISGSICVLYSSWSTGVRSIYLAPAIAVNEMLVHFNKIEEGLQKSCDVEVEFYNC